MNEYLVLFGTQSSIIITSTSRSAAWMQARTLLGFDPGLVRPVFPGSHVAAGALTQLVGASA